MWEYGIHRPTPKHIKRLNEVCRDYTGKPLFILQAVPEPVRLPPEQSPLRSAVRLPERGLPRFKGEDAG
jgi:hypothetical protein